LEVFFGLILEAGVNQELSHPPGMRSAGRRISNACQAATIIRQHGSGESTIVALGSPNRRPLANRSVWLSFIILLHLLLRCLFGMRFQESLSELSCWMAL
jgi:hypothetical protein